MAFIIVMFRSSVYEVKKNWHSWIQIRNSERMLGSDNLPTAHIFDRLRFKICILECKKSNKFFVS